MSEEKKDPLKQQDSANESDKMQSDSYAAAAGALGLDKAAEDCTLDLPTDEQTDTDGSDLNAALDELKEEAEKSRNQMLRAMAEMENMRRIAQRDVSKAHKYALEKFVRELLPVIDSLEGGLGAAEQDSEEMKPLREGMQLTYKMFLGVVSKFGVEQLDPHEQPFDPEQHEAVSMQPSEDFKPNTVLMVVQKGYVLNERVIRPARVIVSKQA